jgi:pSer/pThr/pTyr-binding forkhead associated (FHA) protein
MPSFEPKTDDTASWDIGSLNKTYVNRRPVESAILANGDEIQIGKFRLVFLKHCPPGVNPMAP